jgi:hypothetical protein
MKHKTENNSTKIGIDSAGIWTAEQYVIDSGWDLSCVASTASLGVSLEDRKTLTGKQSDALLEYCVAKTAEAAR